MADIDWDRIALFLKKASSTKLEANKSVTGEGADVSTRVVSSTPEVMNTNANYVGSTPYDTTESFDIKGLTYNNSGNVQIEVVCKKTVISHRRSASI